MRLLTAALIVICAFAPDVSACVCNRDDVRDPLAERVARQFERSDVVFFGAVTEALGGPAILDARNRRWNFDVATTWKGDPSDELTVYAHDRDGRVSSCDVSFFEVGTVYVVFARREPGSGPSRLRVGYCSLSMKVAEGRGLSHLIVDELDSLSERDAQ